MVTSLPKGEYALGMRLSTTTGIKSLPDKGKHFKIQPNPSPREGSFKVILDEAGKGRFSLINMSGKIIRIIDFKDTDELEVSSAGLSPGVYVGKLLTGGGSTYTQKIVIR